MFEEMTPFECAQLFHDWAFWARPEQAPAKRPNARRVTVHNVDEWIAYLQERLRITPEETEQWNAVAQVMRDNAESIHRLVQERNQNQKAMDAIDDLRSYEQLTAAQADGIKRLLPAFEMLYDKPFEDPKKVRVAGPFTSESLSPHRSPAPTR